MSILLKIFRIERLSKIKIQEKFRKHPPQRQKMNERRFYYFWSKKFAVPIVINKENVLIDGYTSYLIAKEHNMEYVPIKRVKD